MVGVELFALGNGEWNVPQLRSLLNAVVSGSAMVDAYEMNLKIADKASRCLVLNAHLLHQHENKALRLVVAINDVTEARAAVREKDALIREKHVLLQELNHRVANSLQIIASVLMHRVRTVQSEETRTHLRDAHHRVMSVATLQRQLAATATGKVRLRPYFTDLCASIGASMIYDPSDLSLTVECDDSVSDADRSVSLGLVVTELVINALKHAFPDNSDGSGPKYGSILVAYRARATGWVLSVSDNGVGMPGEDACGGAGPGNRHHQGAGRTIVG